MRTIFEQVISRGDYDLTAMLQNIDRYHIEGKLTDEDREALYALARQHAAPQYNYDSEIEAILAAIRELQQAQEEGGGTEPTDEWPEFVQPTGAHDAYGVGAQVTYNGQRYRCKLANCVWSPDAYPDAWELVES